MNGDFVFPEVKLGESIPIIIDNILPGPNIVWWGSLGKDPVEPDTE